MLGSSASPYISAPPQPQIDREPATAKRTAVRARFIASLLEEVEHDADADRRPLYEQRHVRRGLRRRVAARVCRVDRGRDLLRLAADPAEPHAKEENELLLGTELQAERRGEVVLGDVLEHELHSGIVREPARVC